MGPHLDFANAFMTVPLAPEEQPFMCTEVEYPVRRGRGPVRPGEPASGTYLVWRVLGFGGRSNPLVYSRVVGLVARISQALLPPGHGMCHLAELWLQFYVDDPALVLAGRRQARARSTSLILLCW